MNHRYFQNTPALDDLGREYFEEFITRISARCFEIRERVSNNYRGETE